MKTINCLGDMCPIPVLMLAQEKESIQNGTCIMIVTDHSCALQTIKHFCNTNHFVCQANEVINGVFEIVIQNENANA